MWSIILGHILGDYFLQSKYMALNKGKDMDVCADHCIIYAACMVGCCHQFLPYCMPLLPLQLLPLFGLIAVSHFLLDHYSLGQVWLRLIKGRTFTGVQDEWDRIFTAIVYVVVDNTLHILCAIGALWLLGAKLWV